MERNQMKITPQILGSVGTFGSYRRGMLKNALSLFYAGKPCIGIELEFFSGIH